MSVLRAHVVCDSPKRRLCGRALPQPRDGAPQHEGASGRVRSESQRPTRVALSQRLTRAALRSPPPQCTLTPRAIAPRVRKCGRRPAAVRGRDVGEVALAPRGGRNQWAHARLAQSVECKALSLVVVGSSPTVGVLFHRRARRRAQQNDGPGRAARNLHRKSAATWRRRQRTPFPRPGPTPLSERRARMRGTRGDQ
jgi:hypothetical protein